MQRYVTEAIGTFFLVLTIQASGNSAMAVGSALLVMTYMSKYISGAHFNPAVTIAVFLRGKLPFKEVIPYWIFQSVGAFAGALIGWLLIRTTNAPEPNANNLWFHAIVGEVVFTFVLALVFLHVTTSEKTEGNSFFGFAIGFTLLACVIGFKRVGEGTFNPAAGLSLHLTNLFNANKGGAIGWFWIPLIFPFVGGALAAFVFQFQSKGNFKAPGASELQDKYESAKTEKAASEKQADSSATTGDGNAKDDGGSDDAEKTDDK